MQANLIKRWHRILFMIILVSATFLLIQSVYINSKPKDVIRTDDNLTKEMHRFKEYDICQKVPLYEKYSIQTMGHTVRVRLKKVFTGSMNVFVILHSHVDPGWLRTFDEYYQSHVEKIINNAVNNLWNYPDLRFIWSEISFLEHWWSKQNYSIRAKVHRLIEEERLEITGGSWVMTDEATTHLSSNIDNMVMGHQYLLQNLNVTVGTSWSVDPFGHGLVMPYLLSLSNINDMVIGRISSIIKEDMRKSANLHFKWVQPWDTETKWAPRVNVLPFLYYTTINACGPDEEVCCMFDVAPTARTFCSERATVQNQKQIARYAKLMANQYRKLQPFYNSRNILVSAGDDFLYAGENDLSTVHEVYSALFDYINTHQEFKMKVKFGTVKEYFDAMQEDKEDLATLIGDFFPYVDNLASNYPFWTAFYSHRPYHKRVERIIMGQLRSLDLLSIGTKIIEESSEVINARRNYALFQHHDGITGTSKSHVMADYIDRLNNTLNTILKENIKILNGLYMDDAKIEMIDQPLNSKTSELLPQRVLDFTGTCKTKHVGILNQNSFNSSHLIQLKVNKKELIAKHNGKAIQLQIVPIIENGKINEDYYMLYFNLLLEPYTIAEVVITYVKSISPPLSIISSSKVIEKSVFPINDEYGEKKFENAYFSLHYNPEKENILTMKRNNKTLYFNINFVFEQDIGGAYVMKTYTRPSVQTLLNKPVKTSMFIRGPVASMIYHQISEGLSYMITIRNEAQSQFSTIDIDIWPNMTYHSQSMILANISASIDSQHFFTDANGMLLIKRIYDEMYPKVGNFYPVPTSAMIEDDNIKLTVITGQSTGVTWIQQNLLMQIDRRTITNDEKGLSAGDADESFPSHLKYRIAVEGKEEKLEENKLYHSFFVHKSIEELLFPPIIFLLNEKVKERKIRILRPLPCNVQLLSAKIIKRNTILISLRRLPFDCSSHPEFICNNDPSLTYAFLRELGDEIYISNLTGTSKGKRMNKEAILAKFLKSLRIITFRIERRH